MHPPGQTSAASASATPDYSGIMYLMGARLEKEPVQLLRFYTSSNERARLGKKRARLEEERKWLEHARSARFLLATAVRLIPQSERARYFEEYRAELLDIPRNTRLRHALSLFRGVFVLRLRRGLRNKAADTAANN